MKIAAPRSPSLVVGVARCAHRALITHGGRTEGGERMSGILVLGAVAIAVVVIMAGLLGRLVDHDDVSSYVER